MCLKMDLKSDVILLLVFWFCYVLSSDLEEGSSCVLPDGTAGVCLKLSDCHQAYKDMKYLVYPKFCSMSLWNPIVCCLDCNGIQDRFYDGISLKLAFKMLLEVEMTDSGKDIHEITENERKIIGCLEASRIEHFPCNKYEEFKNLDDSIKCYDSPFETASVEIRESDDKMNKYPHLALIGYGDNPNFAEWLCSGSIISDKFILTAAHCTSSPVLGEVKFAALGTQKRTDDRSHWQIYGVVRTMVHPDHQPPSKYHDIALLETRVKIINNVDVIPACLQREEIMAEVATATGWGAMGPQKHPTDILKGVNIIKFSHEECMEAYPKHRHLINGYNSNIQACYGNEEYMNDTCEGDSGGPLQIKNNKKKAKCLHTVIGVMSYGRACGLLGTAGLYTRVAPYVPWIESITGNLS